MSIATVRERRVFAALLEEFIMNQPLKGTERLDLLRAVSDFGQTTAEQVKQEAAEQAEFERLYGHEDYRE